jgi:hypothetical protein
LPAEGRSSPPSAFSSVDLPEPDGPTSARISPRLTSIETLEGLHFEIRDLEDFDQARGRNKWLVVVYGHRRFRR